MELARIMRYYLKMVEKCGGQINMSKLRRQFVEILLLISVLTLCFATPAKVGALSVTNEVITYFEPLHDNEYHFEYYLDHIDMIIKVQSFWRGYFLRKIIMVNFDKYYSVVALNNCLEYVLYKKI